MSLRLRPLPRVECHHDFLIHEFLSLEESFAMQQSQCPDSQRGCNEIGAEQKTLRD